MENDLDLRHKARKGVLGLSLTCLLEDRLQSVRLGPDRVDCRNARSIREGIDTVADIRIRWRKDDASTFLISFDWEQPLSETESDRAIGREPRIEGFLAR
jgi:hypothetical protein